MRSEAALEAVCALRAKDRGRMLIKLHHAQVGLPDRILLQPGGQVVFIEFKSKRGRLTKIQRYWSHVLLRMGFRYAVVRNTAEFDVLTEATDSTRI